MSLTCQHITKAYGGREVLRDISLTLEPGRIYGLIGRNGAGKTTLLSILTAQNPATGGTVSLDGQPVWENRKSLEKLCFSRELTANAESGLAAMKVKEYLRIASIYYPGWDKEMEKRLVELFQLNTKKKLAKLSKGMLSMVTIIVAMCSKAPYTILDEPVAGLDVVAREQFYKLLLEEYTETGRTFVVSTHIIEEASDILEEVIVLHEGRLLLMEETQSLLERVRHVSGKAEEVDAATAGLELHHTETVGRSKGVTVFLQPGQSVDETRDVSVQPVSLQRAFVALCGEEERHEA
ncbi:MAG: ABC transporter ATP-binding protein [Oscillospiraceae bacterium]|nr:ABC transporter ATP-binding protein [Oscillospiraceae bacterium]